MGKISTVVLALLAILVMACKGEEKKEEVLAKGQAEMEMVMAIHDEVMPKMSTIGKLVETLKPLAADTTATGQPYQRAMVDLQDAHTAMMDWMKNFGARFDSDEILNGKALSEEKMGWIAEEETKVKALKEQINSSIANAEALIK